MRSNSSAEEADGQSDVGGSIELGLPIRDAELFKHGATTYILHFLSDNPDINVSIRQLSKVTPFSERATREAVNVLEPNGLVETFHKGNARRVQINRERLSKPSDPIRSIPQTEYHTPVRIAKQYIVDELADVQGLILFGSVARGEADRQSDIDLWVLVGGDHMQQRHAANKLAKHLEGLQIPPTIAVADAMNADLESAWNEVKETLESDEQNWASAQRHSFEILVETPQSILNQSDRVDAEKLFGEGITLLSSETLDRVKIEVLSDE
ncbi:nucleotidyltransferase domain-containing protein [Haloarchaeobius amylolyticus]|uniref:nucleotidyltransferase domain-containing protein n=1 Tax=Haloarchaeobius amylolyticus TaxID=1198296 RepID=UPI00226E6E8E|nr:nucleotidyltransferase domain-containing protein [Haloarchaeobius amylolyticus]